MARCTTGPRQAPDPGRATDPPQPPPSHPRSHPAAASPRPGPGRIPAATPQRPAQGPPPSHPRGHPAAVNPRPAPVASPSFFSSKILKARRVPPCTRQAVTDPPPWPAACGPGPPKPSPIQSPQAFPPHSPPVADALFRDRQGALKILYQTSGLLYQTAGMARKRRSGFVPNGPRFCTKCACAGSVDCFVV